MIETNGISALQNVVNDDGRPREGGLASQAGRAAGTPLDIVFLDAQTFADRDLQRDILKLFLDQARRVVPSLPDLSGREQADAAHLLKGSARGIGAWAAAATAEAYETADERARALIAPELAQAFADVEAAITARLATLEG